VKSRRGKDSGRDATSLLATAYVIVIGTLVCMFCVMAFRGDQRILILIGAVATVLLMLSFWLLRTPSGEQQSSIWLFWKTQQQQEDPLNGYISQRRRRRDRNALGTNQPPTLEQIKDATNHPNSWVPRTEKK